MLKKSIYGLLLLAIAMPAFAADHVITKVEVAEWPMVYKFLPMCDKIKVYINVGYYVKIKDCKKLKIYLEQDNGSVENYSGCLKFTIYNNFDLELGATVQPTAAAAALTGDKTVWRAWIDGDNFAPVNTGGVKRTICVGVKKLVISKGTPNKKLHIATATILVRPTASPMWWHSLPH